MQRADTRKYHYIYKITRDDGRYYIGMHSTDDLEDGYFGSGKWITRSIKKHSLNKHKKEIISFCSSRQELINMERNIVTEELLLDPKCMNLCVGGKWGILSEESRLKISAANRRRVGIIHSVERNQKISKAKTGKKFSDEHKKSIGKTKQKPCTIDGVKIYKSRAELVAELGTGKNGERSPNFRYV
jgi:hypothetical protein